MQEEVMDLELYKPLMVCRDWVYKWIELMNQDVEVNRVKHDVEERAEEMAEAFRKEFGIEPQYYDDTMAEHEIKLINHPIGHSFAKILKIDPFVVEVLFRVERTDEEDYDWTLFDMSKAVKVCQHKRFSVSITSGE